MVVIGLTGGIASGKSFVSRVLRELGAAIIDADEVAREVVCPGTLAYEEIVHRFGREMLLPSGNLDRERLGRLVFADPPALEDLNRITHPRILQLIRNRIEESRQRGTAVLVVEAPLLLECGMASMVDEVWLVTAPARERTRRILARDRLRLKEAQSRLGSQIDVKDAMAQAHFVIDNSGTLDELRSRVRDLWEGLKNRRGTIGKDR
ncbi:MAG: dephospho-CoA kinase [Bacillota bacterium]